MTYHDDRFGMPRASRRDFLKRSSTVVAGAALAGPLAVARSAHAAGSDTLKVGLVGCGGRGGGAAFNALKADPNCKLTALADAFEDRLQSCLESVRKRLPEQVAVEPDHCFVGFDAYQNLIQSGVDVVLLATPPHFRPAHLKACIAAGKHVFCEKPVAVDAPGVRSVLATTEEARRKGLSIVSGLCCRYHPGVRAIMQRVLDGAIGEILAIQETWNSGPLWYHERQPDWTEMQYQMRNWYYFTWLSGDHNVEQHVHSLDKALWAMRDEPPVRAWGLGGRQVRVEPKWGNIYDHHAVVYEYANGVPVYSYCRQMAGCFDDTSDLIIGSKGRASVWGDFRIEGPNAWEYDLPGAAKAAPAGGKQPASTAKRFVRSFKELAGNMYDLEHQALFAAIRAGSPVNNGVYMARSTMMAILGRMATYTGKVITWDEAINSKEDLSPARYAWDADPPILPDADGKYPVAIPGVTKPW